jgi:hypothetical protein
MVGKDDWCLELTALDFHMQTVLKSGSLNFLETLGIFQACSGIALPLC